MHIANVIYGILEGRGMDVGKNGASVKQPGSRFSAQRVFQLRDMPCRSNSEFLHAGDRCFQTPRCHERTGRSESERQESWNGMLYASIAERPQMLNKESLKASGSRESHGQCECCPELFAHPLHTEKPKRSRLRTFDRLSSFNRHFIGETSQSSFRTHS